MKFFQYVLLSLFAVSAMAEDLTFEGPLHYVPSTYKDIVVSDSVFLLTPGTRIVKQGVAVERNVLKKSRFVKVHYRLTESRDKIAETIVILPRQ